MNPKPKVKIVKFRAEYLPAFIALNREWIEKFFILENADIEQLHQAETKIIASGGEIFFVLKNDQAVGACAMVKYEHGFELAKMAVKPEAQGKGYSKLLMNACINWAKAKKLNHIFILSNRKLETAITLYKKFGFVEEPVSPNPYARANIQLRLKL